jgi:phosphoglycolate phosphatase-like HAD superfamily hydrolase
MQVSRRRILLAGGALVCLFASSNAAFAQSDPLPSWNDGEHKAAIVDFVSKVTKEGGPDFVAPAERIAAFDNDGTLWAEQPIYFQLEFAFDELKRIAPQHPNWSEKEPYKSVLANDLKGVMAFGEKSLIEILAVTHSGMTTEAFNKTVADWFATARHPTKKRPYDQLVYVPQLELLAYLRANGFKTFIVSGGGIEFMRVFADRSYGIPPEQVVGSSGVVKFQLDANGKPELIKEPKIEFVDNGPGKPVGINRFIGRRPILAFGNSDGDQQMLEYVALAPGPSLALLHHHTDAVREWAYDRHSEI